MSHQCPATDCGKVFKNHWGLKVHFFRKHGGSVESYMANGSTELDKNTAVLDNSTSTVRKSPIIEKIVEIIRAAPNKRIKNSDLIQKLAESGITSKTADAMKQRIYCAINSNPQSGITKPERGVYVLADQKKANKTKTQTPISQTDIISDNDGLADLPAEIHLRFKEIELRRLKAQLSTNHEIFAGLTRLLALSVMSQQE